MTFAQAQRALFVLLVLGLLALAFDVTHTARATEGAGCPPDATALTHGCAFR